MNLPGFHKRKGPERLATPQELAEYGGPPSDPATEAQILSLMQEEMSNALKKGAEESAAQAKVAALRELAAVLGPEVFEETAAASEIEEIGVTGSKGKIAGKPSDGPSEPERVAAAFFGEGQGIQDRNQANEVC